MSAAFGSMRPMDQKRYVAMLRRAAGGSRAAAPATPEALAAMGVAVVVVPATETRADG